MASASKVGLGNHVESAGEMMSHHFDLFSRSKTETSMLDGYEHEIHLTTRLTEEGPYEFILPPSNEFIHLPRTRLEITGQIVLAANDGAPTAVQEIGVCNLFPHALFRQVDVFVGNINTSNQDNLYPYKAYFETVFSYSKIAKTAQLKDLCCYVEDTVTKEDITTLGAGDDVNRGFNIRNGMVRQAKIFNFNIPIHADIFQCNRLVPPNTPVRIVLTRNVDAFPLIVGAAVGELKIKLLDLHLYVKKIIPSERAINYFATKLLKDEVILPFSRSVIKKETIPQNVTNYYLKLFNGEQPRQLLITMLHQTRVNGSKNLNPFVFEHFNLNYLNLRINGLSVPSKPYQPNFANGIVARELRALYDNTGINKDHISFLYFIKIKETYLFFI